MQKRINKDLEIGVDIKYAKLPLLSSDKLMVGKQVICSDDPEQVETIKEYLNNL